MGALSEMQRVAPLLRTLGSHLPIWAFYPPVPARVHRGGPHANREGERVVEHRSRHLAISPSIFFFVDYRPPILLNRITITSFSVMAPGVSGLRTVPRRPVPVSSPLRYDDASFQRDTTLSPIHTAGSGRPTARLHTSNKCPHAFSRLGGRPRRSDRSPTGLSRGDTYGFRTEG